MLKNYFITAFRNLFRQRLFSLINILGFAVGICSFILIGLYVYRELTFDRYHDKANRIYRIVENLRTENELLLQSTSSPPMGPTIAATFPEIENYVRMQGTGGILRQGEKSFFENDIYFADSTMFDIFSYDLKKGDTKSALVKPYSMVITERTAKKFFPGEDPIGKMLDFDGKPYTITGLMGDVRDDSHFQFNILISFSTIISRSPEMNKNEWWYWNGFHTYFLVREGEDQINNLRAKMPEYIKTVVEAKQSKDLKMHYEDLPLQQLTSIYLETPRSWENGARGNKANVYILSIIAVFILGTAVFNYVNLATARASRRLKEVGLRKVMGAERGALVRQFLGESVIVSFIATLAGFGLAAILLPAFNTLLGTNLHITTLPVEYMIASWLIMVFGLGFLSGLYPAFLISGFHPLLIFKNSPRSIYGHNALRRILVTGQFAISIMLIASTFLVYDQLTLLKTEKLGFNKDAVIKIPYNGNDAVRDHLATIKDELLKIPGVKIVSASDVTPGESTGNNYTSLQNGQGQRTDTNINTSGVDADFLPTFDIKLIAGRNFSKELPGDDSVAYIMNMSAVKQMGFKSPEDALGTPVNSFGKIVGVVGDYRYRSLHYAVEPLLLHNSHWWYSQLSVRVETDDMVAMVKKIEGRWNKLVPNIPFLYTFLDQDYNNLYKSEAQLGKVVTVFSGLAILVACLGLFGLTSFAVQRRFKEIGIRKALGASVGSVVGLISSEFIILIAIAFLIAVPITYYLVTLWLHNFTDRIDIGSMRFILAGLAVLAIAWLS
ncbi:MAG: ABC transporter permease, partial [Chryseolinea sp.]